MIDAVDAALWALVGGVIVALTRGAVEHRRWLRDNRSDGYSAFLHVTDQLRDATDTYLGTFCFLFERSLDASEGEQERPAGWWRQTSLAADLEEQWTAVRAARDEFFRHQARVELLAPARTDRAAKMIRFEHPLPPHPASLDNVHERDEEMAHECQRWADKSDQRREDRRRFLRCAREDLRVHPWDPRPAPRHAWRRLRTLVRRGQQEPQRAS